MKKDKIYLLIMIIICLATIPFVTNAQETSRTKRKLLQEEEKKVEKVVQAKKPQTDCGYSRPMRVAGFIANPPFSWVERTDDDALVTYGYSFDVFRKIAEKLQLRYQSVGYTSYEDTLNALKRGEIDLVLSAYLPHALGVGTTPVYPAYFTNLATVYFRADKAKQIQSLDELADLRGIIRREENMYQLFQNKQKLDHLKLQQVSTAQKAFEMLLNDEADYLLGSPYSIEAELRRFKLKKHIVYSKIAALDGGANLFFVLSSNSSCLPLKKLLSSELQNYVNSKTAKSEVLAAIESWAEEFRDEEGLLPLVEIKHSSTEMEQKVEADESAEQNEDADDAENGIQTPSEG